MWKIWISAKICGNFQIELPPSNHNRFWKYSMETNAFILLVFAEGGKCVLKHLFSIILSNLICLLSLLTVYINVHIVNTSAFFSKFFINKRKCRHKHVLFPLNSFFFFCYFTSNFYNANNQMAKPKYKHTLKNNRNIYITK